MLLTEFWDFFVSCGLAASSSDLVISLSNSSLARLNSPVLLPIPRANSGSFFAPKRSNTIMKRITISPPPGIPKARVCVISVLVVMA